MIPLPVDAKACLSLGNQNTTTTKNKKKTIDKFQFVLFWFVSIKFNYFGVKSKQARQPIEMTYRNFDLVLYGFLTQPEQSSQIMFVAIKATKNMKRSKISTKRLCYYKKCT